MGSDREGFDYSIDEADEHEDCEFCQGAKAARDGLIPADNPYPAPTAKPKTIEWCEDPNVLWEFGFSAECNAPWRQRGHANPDRTK